MTKKFRELIPNIELPDNLSAAVEYMTVEKVVPSKDRTKVTMHITSTRLIAKKEIWQLEAQVRSKCFPGKDLQVKIREKFRLSTQYTPELLLKAYRESIELEVKAYSMIMFEMLHHAEITFPQKDLCHIQAEGNVLYQMKSSEMKCILEKIFNERCGFGVEVEFEWTETKAHFTKQADLELKQAAAAVTASVESAVAATKEAEAAKKENTQTEKKAEDTKKTGAAANTGAGSAPGAAAKQGGAPGSGGYRSGGRSYEPRKSDNPDVLYGRDFEDEPVALETVVGEMGEITIRGTIIAVEIRELRSGNFMVMYDVTDYTDTITVKMFTKAENIDTVKGIITKGANVLVRGVTTVDRFDGELTLSNIWGIKKTGKIKAGRVDNAPVKRVELHCHTKMSEMDAVSEVSELCKTAKGWGHKALAITDHGVVQGFTDAYHTIGDSDPFKIIYGCEGYLVDDTREIVQKAEGQSLDSPFVVFDLETTGLSTNSCKIIEIGAVRFENGLIVDRFSRFVDPEEPIPFEIEQLTSIDDSMVQGAGNVSVVLPDFLKFCEGAIMVAHNAAFDMSFVEHFSKELELDFNKTSIDTVALARILLPNLKNYKLDTVAKALDVSLEHHHRAVDDAECTAHIFEKLCEILKERDVTDVNGINEMGTPSIEAIRKMPMYHVILLARSSNGRINLYRMISEAHLTYYAGRPRIPKSLLNKCREGIIVGSACEAGELFQAVEGGKSDADIARLVNYYDYLEIQPLCNNMFMLKDDKRSADTVEDLMELNRRIVRLGEQFNKPVVATCDAHFINPEDGIYRQIMMSGKGFDDTDDQPALYLRTTEEMLKEFEYLGSEKAYEIVVTNTNLIADMCEKISPVRPDKCPPVIPDSDKTLREICYQTAKKQYGEDLPQIVVDRLEKELNSIISNGYSVMYIIAQKLVWKSNDDGYLVGSRGSVGSSLAATMSGITEVNALSPHYYCPNCHYYDFDSDEVKAFSGMAGCDMPDKLCPKCGKPLKKDGFDIPFETFLGFKGNKEPDIDLNFSSEYQSHAHDYTEVIFGHGYTFKAGTVGTLADKTAFGYVKNYYEERGVRKRKCEINRILQGLVGVKRTTGQHPGGIIVMPHGEEIYSFTPIQHPANDMESKTITTHFDYHSIDHNLLKLDILGHDDPTMIRMLEDLTGINARDIPLDSREVMSLFQNTSALGITPEDIGGCKLGALGIPEFGTDFAMQMLLDTKPQYLSDLVRIAGLAHGTDVWLGNAQELIKSGKATIQTAICCRDDIMIYLISKGMDKELSFTIMESVRKGKGLKPDWITMMTEHGVPDWYIWSCKKIKYMFPKAHAAAYVMMAWRIAYCKIFYPLAFYSAFFSIRSPGFSFELMCLGRDVLERHIANYKRNEDKLTDKEQDTLRAMRIVQEMYARGFEFCKMDLFKAQATRFMPMDGKIMPCLSCIDGIGENAAIAIVEAAKGGPFLSKEDFMARSHLGQGVVDTLSRLGLLGGIPDKNQLSIFDWVY